MMRKKVSIFGTWIAVCMMLLSTIVMHHHHNERICIVFEQCSHDDARETNRSVEGDVFSENTHTHQENGSCRIHQLHRFIINAKILKDIRQHLIVGGMSSVALSSDRFTLGSYGNATIVRWMLTATPLSQRALSSISRRGPPQYA